MDGPKPTNYTFNVSYYFASINDPTNYDSFLYTQDVEEVLNPFDPHDQKIYKLYSLSSDGNVAVGLAYLSTTTQDFIFDMTI